jgi:undecaprenyl-diphosphatase
VDVWLFQQLNGLAGRWLLFDLAVRLLVNEYLVLTGLSLLLFGLWFTGQQPAVRARHQRALIVALLAVLVANAVVKGLNLVYFRPRPFAGHPVTLLFYRPTDSSWPSNPATAAFALASAQWLHNRRTGAVGLVLAGLMAVARVIAGVHYPLDVISGSLIGYTTAWWLARKAPPVDRLTGWVIRVGRRVYLA